MASAAKGYLNLKWKRAQCVWEKTTNSPDTSMKWSREMIIIIHTYVYACWKERNKIIHGNTEKSERHIKREALKAKIVTLYNKGRANLTLREKRYFKVPIDQRVKRSTESLTLWIAIVQSIFKRKGAATQQTLDTWTKGDGHNPSKIGNYNLMEISDTRSIVRERDKSKDKTTVQDREEWIT